MFKKILGTFTLLAAVAAAQTPPTASARQAVYFMDVHDGDLISQGQKIHVSMNRPPAGLTIGAPTVPTVEFRFTPEPGEASFTVGTDNVGTVPELGPGCVSHDCLVHGVYTLPVSDPFQHFRSGWGRLSARISTHQNDDAFVRVYLQYQPGSGVFLQPSFQQPLPTNHQFPVMITSQADNITGIQAVWIQVTGGNRNINPFEQHVDGPAVSFNGNASCVPTAVGANLAWLNDTSQWTTVAPPIVNGCANTRDYCMVTFLGTLMGTNSAAGGTSGAGADTGLVAYLKALGYQKGVDYFLSHGAPGIANIPGTVPEYLLSHFLAGEMISVGLHNYLPGQGSFGHFLALDNIVVNPDGTSLIRLMDPNTINSPPSQGIYRWFTLHPDGVVDFGSGSPTPGYGPAELKLDEVQIVSGFHFFNFGGISFNLSMNHPAIASPATSVVPTGGIVALKKQGNDRWTGTFAPPTGSPGPWLLISDVTLESGHTLRDYKYVTGAVSPPR